MQGGQRHFLSWCDNTIVDKQEYIFKSFRKRGRRPKMIKPVDLDYIHQKDGYYDGKIFFSFDKVTYTFVDNEEVVVLHYDSVKNSLFLKGHKIVSLNQHPDLELYLSKFKKCLIENSKTEKFVKPFDAVISSLCRAN
ncbi:MAG: hypothetical protein HQM16_03315 [Deltaproteobacteria bacterium]|nr:hypothetical protein [Deltaproteobacteria bacterium]